MAKLAAAENADGQRTWLGRGPAMKGVALILSCCLDRFPYLPGLDGGRPTWKLQFSSSRGSLALILELGGPLMLGKGVVHLLGLGVVFCPGFGRVLTYYWSPEA